LNLPNAITIGRILISPLIAALPFVNSPLARIAAFCLFITAAVSDYIDGMLARTRNLETDLGRLLDPLADKLLLFATMIPIYVLMAPDWDLLAPTAASLSGAHGFPFQTPFGPVAIPWWIFAVVIGRELFMTVFRQLAARRGVVIGAIGPAKWKTGFQWVWVGSSYFWFYAFVGLTTMAIAVFLTLYSLFLYMKTYRRVLTG
jgi:CDP-diacylglycerol--glycerol-3-phosphate 3-phosphatidyltransferase